MHRNNHPVDVRGSRSIDHLGYPIIPGGAFRVTVAIPDSAWRNHNEACQRSACRIIKGVLFGVSSCHVCHPIWQVSRVGFYLAFVMTSDKNLKGKVGREETFS